MIFNNRKGAILKGHRKDQLLYEKLLKNKEAQENIKKIKSNLTRLNGSNNKQYNIWKLKNKFYPKIKPAMPVAKKNLAGKIITNGAEKNGSVKLA